MPNNFDSYGLTLLRSGLPCSCHSSVKTFGLLALNSKQGESAKPSGWRYLGIIANQQTRQAGVQGHFEILYSQALMGGCMQGIYDSWDSDPLRCITFCKGFESSKDRIFKVYQDCVPSCSSSSVYSLLSYGWERVIQGKPVLSLWMWPCRLW